MGLMRRIYNYVFHQINIFNMYYQIGVFMCVCLLHLDITVDKHYMCNDMRVACAPLKTFPQKNEVSMGLLHVSLHFQRQQLFYTQLNDQRTFCVISYEAKKRKWFFEESSACERNFVGCHTQTHRHRHIQTEKL